MTDRPAPPTFEARPPAKVNLTLEVVGRRPDGFHELRSIFLRIGLSDGLTMAPGTAAYDRLTVTGLPGTPVEGNLVLKALDAIRAHVGVNLPPFDITLGKQIPAAAGLGGGSSDAAYALKLALEAWGDPVARQQEFSLAESLGSDVPFFYFRMAAAFVSGRGEEVSALSGIYPGLGILLATPPSGLNTKAVFARFDELVPFPTDDQYRGLTRGSHERDTFIDIFYDEPTTQEVLAWAARLRDGNDLWVAAADLQPSLAMLRDELENETGRPWQMSGSGPTLFSLYASVAAAARAGQALVASHLPSLENVHINAVDLVGPDPVWRYP